MFQSPAIREFDPGLPGVAAFRITARVTRDDMAALSDHMLGLFDRQGEIDMLLSFLTDDTATPGASLSVAALKAQVQSLSHVRNYAVAGAPAWAATMIETMGRLIPVRAQTFDSEAQALAWLGAQDRPGAPPA